MDEVSWDMQGSVNCWKTEWIMMRNQRILANNTCKYVFSLPLCDVTKELLFFSQKFSICSSTNEKAYQEVEEELSIHGCDFLSLLCEFDA